MISTTLAISDRSSPGATKDVPTASNQDIGGKLASENPRC